MIFRNSDNNVIVDDEKKPSHYIDDNKKFGLLHFDSGDLVAVRGAIRRTRTQQTQRGLDPPHRHFTFLLMFAYRHFAFQSPMST